MGFTTKSIENDMTESFGRALTWNAETIVSLYPITVAVAVDSRFWILLKEF